jgi:DNA-binding transcriptional ArsR family regulator
MANGGVDMPREVSILNYMVQYQAGGDGVNLVASAIADPTRRAILQHLAGGPATISDIAKPFSITLTGFCKHVRVLERARLVRRTRRGRENVLTLSPGPLREVADWILHYEKFWTERVERLEEFFAAENEKEKPQ